MNRLLVIVALSVACQVLAQSGDFVSEHRIERHAVRNLEAYAAFKSGDRNTARGIWRELAAAGNTTAMWNLAHLLEQQSDDDQAGKEAFQWIREAAERGDARAQYQLGIAYEKGVQVARDLRQAEHWLLRSARQDYADSQLAYGLLLATEFGRGVDQVSAEHQRQAMIWLSRAARAGVLEAEEYLRVLERNSEALRQVRKD